MTVASPARGSSRRSLLVGLLVVVVIVVVGLLASGGDTRRSGPALSPRSDTPSGTSALVELLRVEGGDASIVSGVPGVDRGTALLLVDVLTDAERRALRDWVRAGHTLVVADITSPLAASVDSARGAGATIERGACDLAGVDGVESVATGADRSGLAPAPPARFELPTGATSCFDRYVVRVPTGDGAIVSVGGPQPFVNGLLGTGDGSTLAVDLLVPERGTRVAVIDTVATAGQGRESLSDLVAPRVKAGLGLAVVAFVLYALHRGRRLGAPVSEPQQVTIPGSGLVEAVGLLHQRGGAAYHSASILRAELRRSLERRYGLPADAPTATLAGVIADRTSIEPSRVLAALDDTLVTDEQELVALAHELDQIRQEAIDVRR